MKKIIILILSISLLVLAACSGQAEPVPEAYEPEIVEEYIEEPVEVEPVVLEVEEPLEEEPQEEPEPEELPEEIVEEPVTEPVSEPAQSPQAESAPQQQAGVQTQVPPPAGSAAPQTQAPSASAQAAPSAGQTEAAPVQSEQPIQEQPPASPPPSATQPSGYASGEGTLVWLSQTGTSWHSINNCGRMNPANARQVTLESVRSNSRYSACRNCNPPR